MKPETSDRKVVIEQHKKFSESSFWRMQREYFDKEGINAWVNQVPFYITSNPYIANCYAHLFLSFVKDWTTKYPESKQHPFYIMELGTGSGRFSYYVIKTIAEQLEKLQIKDISICYVMSDFTKNNIKYWESHPTLKPFVDNGMIDFAMFDMESERPVTLIKKNIRLGPDVLVNPLTVFANYIFDTVSHDSFAVHEGKLYELLMSLSTSETNMKDNRPVDMEQITVDYNVKEIRSGYYGDQHLDAILDIYRNSLKETSFLFPIGSFNAIKFLRKLSDDKLFIISTDKGYSTVEQLDHLGHPSISFHGSFSMMVNFHAIAEYFNRIGGEGFLQTSCKGIKTSVFSSGFKFSDLPATKALVDETVEGFSPSDYFVMHSRIRDHFHDYDLETIAAHMEFSRWDPHIYLKLSNRITSLIAESPDYETMQFMAAKMHKMAENYYHMPKTECILFEIGVFFHAIKDYKSALDYYLKALPYVGEQFGLFYNMALCYHHLEQKEEALKAFQKALELDPESKETQEWINHIQNPVSENTDTKE